MTTDLSATLQKRGSRYGKFTGHADSWHDIAGCAQLVADRLNGIER